ncbi:uncharacterized protein LOC134183856 [Corticium candelabrum]|uniref:uncharacterized protein LOC134183856 n=1 Tax=Corticium candelabrum TaxID=121492 RepID=UPI002E35DB62|nr:uncharacterized protein LOC134183856 [Corticium candelabrum]
MALVIVRLRKAQAFRESCLSNAASRTHKAIEKRFLLVVIVVPLCFGAIFTGTTVYDRLSMRIIADYFDYVYCLHKHPDDHSLCSADFRNYGYIIACLIGLLLLNVQIFVVLASTVMPRPARRFWRDRLLTLVRCCRTKTNR